MSDSNAQRVIIVGAGHGGGAVAATLRQYGFKGAITVIGTEPIAPYQRPPLSKAWLKGEADAASLALRPPAFYDKANIDLRLSTTVTAINTAAKTVATDAGDTLGYDWLILATGARARRLPIPGMELAGVLELRTAADADQLKSALGPGKRLAVVGGGYIGLEAAASATALGSTATVIERENRVLARVASVELSEAYQVAHRKRGVAIELSAQVAALEGADGKITGVRLGDGRLVPCDVALVGVGAVANIELAQAAGIACDLGITVDLAARTSDPSVFAIGDCTWRPLPHYGRDFRLESVPNALEQARQAAASICGRALAAPEVPWFWSDQFDLKLQIVGLDFGATHTVLRGDPATESFAVFHLTDDNRLRAVEAVNMPDAFMAGRLLIAKDRELAPAQICDMSVAMKDLKV